MTLREVFIRRSIPWYSAPNNHLSICCPVCPENGETPDTRFRLSINLTTGACICFNCGFKRKTNSFSKILRALNMSNYVVEEDTGEEEEVETPKLPDDFQVLDHIESDLDKIAVRYLRNRGVTPEQVTRKRIGISLTGRYAYRIIFPVKDDKKLTGIVSRDFTDQQEPRYLNSKGDKGLYNLTSFQAGSPVILSEGVFKALRIERLNTGFASLSLLGKAITEFQIQQLQSRGCKQVILWPDPDKPGRNGAANVADKLSELGFLVGVVWPVYQPADIEPLESMEKTWGRIEGFSWRLRQRLHLGVES